MRKDHKELDQAKREMIGLLENLLIKINAGSANNSNDDDDTTNHNNDIKPWKDLFENALKELHEKLLSTSECQPVYNLHAQFPDTLKLYKFIAFNPNTSGNSLLLSLQEYMKNFIKILNSDSDEVPKIQSAIDGLGVMQLKDQLANALKNFNYEQLLRHLDNINDKLGIQVDRLFEYPTSPNFLFGKYTTYNESVSDTKDDQDDSKSSTPDSHFSNNAMHNSLGGGIQKDQPKEENVKFFSNIRSKVEKIYTLLHYEALRIAYKDKHPAISAFIRIAMEGYIQQLKSELESELESEQNHSGVLSFLLELMPDQLTSTEEKEFSKHLQKIFKIVKLKLTAPDDKDNKPYLFGLAPPKLIITDDDASSCTHLPGRDTPIVVLGHLGEIATEAATGLPFYIQNNRHLSYGIVRNSDFEIFLTLRGMAWRKPPSLINMLLPNVAPSHSVQYPPAPGVAGLNEGSSYSSEQPLTASELNSRKWLNFNSDIFCRDIILKLVLVLVALKGELPCNLSKDDLSSLMNNPIDYSSMYLLLNKLMEEIRQIPENEALRGAAASNLFNATNNANDANDTSSRLGIAAIGGSNDDDRVGAAAQSGAPIASNP